MATVGELLERTGTKIKVVGVITQLAKTPDQAERMIRELMSWTWITNNKSVTFLGRCSFRNNTIEIHGKLNLNKIESTVYHECAHYIAHRIYKSTGHDRAWKHVMSCFGLAPDVCSASTEISELKVERAKWRYVCTDCGYEYHTIRRLKNIDNRFHGPCRHKDSFGRLKEIQLR